jgi:H+/Cl- antiporter ClcA
VVRKVFVRWMPWLPVRLAVGGAVVLAATLAVGTRDYNGLSLPLLDTALAGGTIAGAAFAWKAGFTAVTVGSGFRGGEVTPLFVIGATLGVTLAAWWGAPAGVLAAVGMVATFGAAANAPLASTVMGVELFGWYAFPLLVVGCVVARICSGPHHLYVDGDADEPTEQDHGSVRGRR